MSFLLSVSFWSFLPFSVFLPLYFLTPLVPVPLLFVLLLP
jgi:hypothetical protein